MSAGAFSSVFDRAGNKIPGVAPQNASARLGYDGKAGALAGLYSEDAVVQVIDRDNPPSKPRNLQGRSAIAAYFEDVCGRDMTHKVEAGVAVGNRLAFTQRCAYPDGTKVFCSAMIDLKGGKIARQVVVQAWDG